MYSVFLDNRFDIAKLLLQHKADPNLVSKVTFKGMKREVYYLPLTFAADRLPIDYMKVLLEYSADPSVAYVSRDGKKHLNATYPMNVVVKSTYLPSKWSRDEYLDDIRNKIELLLSYGADFSTKDNVAYTVFEDAEINPEILLYIMDKEKNTKLYGSKLMKNSKNSWKNSNQETRVIYEKIINKLTEAGYK